MFFLSSKMIAIIALAISLFAALISVFTLWHQVKPEQAQVSSDLSLAKEKLEDMVSDFESRLRTGFETQDDFIVSLKEQIRAELNDIKSASARDKEQGQVSVSKTDRNYLDVRISRLEDSIKAIQPVNEDLNRDMNFLGTQDDLSAGLFAASGLLAANNSGMPLDHWVIILKQINDGGYNLTYLNELEKAVRSDPPDFEQLMRVARELVPEMAQALNSAKADSGFAEQLLADFRKLVKLRRHFGLILFNFRKKNYCFHSLNVISSSSRLICILALRPQAQPAGWQAGRIELQLSMARRSFPDVKNRSPDSGPLRRSA